MQEPQQSQSQPAIPVASPAKQWKRWRWPALIGGIAIIAVVVAVVAVVVSELDDWDEGEGQTSIAWVGEYSGTSARQAARQALAEFSGKYGLNVIARRAIGDSNDRELEAVLHVPDRQLLGLLVARVGQGNMTTCRIQIGSQVQFMQFGAPAGGQADQCADAHQGQRGDAPAAQPLRPVPFPDGSGSIDLPDGWRVAEASEGRVVAVGPQGQSAELGWSSPVYYPEAVQMRTPVMTVAAYGRIEDAIPSVQQQIWDMRQRFGGPPRRFTQLVALVPVACSLQGGRSALVCYDFQQQGRQMRSLSLVIQSEVPPFNWMHYYSAVISPRDRFDQDLPTLMAIWTSREVSQWVHDDALRKAWQTMQESHQIVQSTVSRRQEVADNAHRNWVQYIRGDRGVENVVTGERRTIDESMFERMRLNDMIQERNRYGHQQYREVPVNELIP